MKRAPRSIELIDQAVTAATQRGLLQLQASGAQLDGRSLRIGARDVVNFSSCSYLGLEMDARLREGAVDAIERYGTQFSSSRSYVSAPPYEELEELLGRIFEAPVVATPSTTLAHLAALPVLVAPDDAVVLDHQVHHSVSLAANQLRVQGTHIELVRHARIDMLDDKIRKLAGSHPRIWYLGDGVYSMYGDLAPTKGLAWLLERHDQLRLYLDDAHGMSWTGSRGRGYVAESLPRHERVFLAVSLNKSFAAGGGALVFPDAESMRRVRTCGATLIFSGPLQPPMLGAAIASARLHLTPEIEALQGELKDRIRLVNRIARELDLPLVSTSETPIRYVGLGPLAASFDMASHLIERGFLTNTTGFPAVSARRAGVRFTVTRHHRPGDIRGLLETMAERLTTSLEEGGSDRRELNRIFGLTPPSGAEPVPAGSLALRHDRSITALDAEEWNRCLGGRGIFDAGTLEVLEQVFDSRQEPENRWGFHYFTVRDPSGRLVLATFFTEALWKDDLLAPAQLSELVESRRDEDPFFLTSRTLSMGALLTEGDHLYLDREADWKGALHLLLAALQELQEEHGITTLALRDLPADDEALAAHLEGSDFLRLPAPDSWLIEATWADEDEFLAELSSHERRFHRRNVQPFDAHWQVEVLGGSGRTPSAEELAHFERLYRNVKERALDLNTFTLPGELFGGLLAAPGWEMLALRLAPDAGGEPGALPQGFVLSRTGDDRYDWLLVGMDYDFVETHGLYRQLVAHVVRRARALGLTRIGLGMGSSRVKKRFGARRQERVLYVRSSDHFHHDVLDQMAADLAAGPRSSSR